MCCVFCVREMFSLLSYLEAIRDGDSYCFSYRLWRSYLYAYGYVRTIIRMLLYRTQEPDEEPTMCDRIFSLV